MKHKEWIVLLVCSALAVIPGTAKAEDLDIRTQNVRVTISENGGVNIINYGSEGMTRPFYPSQWSTYHRPEPHFQVPQAPCYGSDESYQRTHTSHSNGNHVYTRSSVATRVCQ